MSTEIELTHEELQMATVTCALGVASTRSLPDGGPKVPWDDWIELAGASLAVGKLLGQYVGADIGRVGPYVVRDRVVFWTDEDATPIIFVDAHPPRYTVKGWLYAHEAKCDANWDPLWWADRYLVPSKGLHPLEELPRGRQSQGAAVGEGGG